MTRARARGLFAAAIVLALVGCGQDRSPCDPGTPLPDHFTLTATGLTVEIERDPYRYTVTDASGRVVLRSLAGGTGDGYAAVGYTTGTTSYSPNPLQGYTLFSTRLDPYRDRLRVVAVEQSDAESLTVTLASNDVKDACVRVAHTVRPSTLRVEASLADPAAPAPRAWASAFETPADEAFLGLGERFNRVDQRGVDVFSWPEEGGVGGPEASSMADPSTPYPSGQAMTYYPVPFFLSTKGYAFWLDTTFRSELNLASSPAHADAWRAWHVGPRSAYEVYVPVVGDTRPWPYQLIDLFTAATGRPMVPPAWSYGPRRRIDPDDQQGGVPEIQAMRDLDLAITSADDATHFLPNASEVGREAQLTDFVTRSHALGYRNIGYYNAYFDTSPTNPIRNDVELALANHWFLSDATGTPQAVFLLSGSSTNVYSIDITSADATAFFTRQFDRAIKLGYSGWMYDFGEYVQFDALASNGMTGEELHNLFPVLYQKAAHDALEAGPLKGDWLLFARSGYTGASAYMPWVWSGDPAASFEDSQGLPAMVRAAINLGVSGVPHWGSDIGGYKCTPDGAKLADGELLTRWIQMGSTTPDMHDEDSCSLANNLQTYQKATIFSSPDAQTAWRTYARLHTRLQPYFRTLSAEAHATGAPIVRHLFLEHPDQPELARVDDAYYVGPALLAAPVVHRGLSSRTLPLPKGRYLDWRDRKLVTGAATVTLDAPLDKLPLLLRDGYLVPLLDPRIDTLAEETNPDVIGPDDVTDVYDVVGLLSREVGHAAITLFDGGTLAVDYAAAFDGSGITAAASEDELATCMGCYLREDLGGGLVRLRVSAIGAVLAGGVGLHSTVPRRIRWDLFLVD